jgi:pimeloyl-ACP methyl ester carboxylesterase
VSRGGAIRAAVAAVAAATLLHPALAAAQGPAPGPAASGDFAGRVTIPGGRQLYLECHGVGSPTVIFEAGLRGRGDIWNYARGGGVGAGVFPRVSGFTHACFYDRPGTLLGLDNLSRSDPVPMPRSTGEVVSDLHELLWAAGVPGPYVFVGASTGGLIARQYTSSYPAEVAGMVLVDAISEGVQRGMRQWQFAFYNQYYLQSPSPEITSYRDLEAIDFYRSFAEMRVKPRPPRQLPIVVLSNDFGFGDPEGVPPRFARLVNRVWKKAQTYLLGLGGDAKQLTAEGSGHQIALNSPGLVARMTAQVVSAVRNGHRLVPRRRHR